MLKWCRTERQLREKFCKCTSKVLFRLETNGMGLETNGLDMVGKNEHCLSKMGAL